MTGGDDADRNGGRRRHEPPHTPPSAAAADPLDAPADRARPLPADEGARPLPVTGRAWPLPDGPEPVVLVGPPSATLVVDRHWAGERRSAVRVATVMLAVMAVFDLANGTLTAPRGLCWTAVALLLLAVLHPARVSAGDGWLASRGLLRERWVHTDLLTSVVRAEGMAPRLVLRDVFGHRVELDPKVLTANPLLWHELDRGARRSLQRGLLRCGEAPLRALAARIDGDGARRLLESSGLD
ncbi:hypothetical protein [Streptomyces sp. SAJ15]|uniref:hypothetical protein n=1 Tax=Streptomyces sp. SAJ15 TaxID=2011095 RepID=UPI0021B36260|nr:hypothetical protein [Streptomyces sp. SAJ15]